MKLVIAEKPSVAMALASVLGARTRKDGYVEGNGYIWLDYVMHRNTMKNIKNGDMMICRLCQNVGNIRYWKVRKSSLES